PAAPREISSAAATPAPGCDATPHHLDGLLPELDKKIRPSRFSRQSHKPQPDRASPPHLPEPASFPHSLPQSHRHSGPRRPALAPIESRPPLTPVLRKYVRQAACANPLPPRETAVRASKGSPARLRRPKIPDPTAAPACIPVRHRRIYF